MNTKGFSRFNRVIAPSSLIIVCLLASAPSYALQTGSNKVAPALQTGSNKVAPALQTGSNKVAPALQTGSNKVAPALQTGSNKVVAGSTAGSFSSKSAANESCDLTLSVSSSNPCN